MTSGAHDGIRRQQDVVGNVRTKHKVADTSIRNSIDDKITTVITSLQKNDDVSSKEQDYNIDDVGTIEIH